jgi:hypothetical protein
MVEFAYPYVPPEVFALNPTPEETFITLEGKGSQRVIFANVPLLAEEEKQLAEFRKYVAEHKKTFPPWYYLRYTE